VVERSGTWAAAKQEVVDKLQEHWSVDNSLALFIHANPSHLGYSAIREILGGTRDEETGKWSRLDLGDNILAPMLASKYAVTKRMEEVAKEYGMTCLEDGHSGSCHGCGGGTGETI